MRSCTLQPAFAGCPDPCSSADRAKNACGPTIQLFGGKGDYHSWTRCEVRDSNGNGQLDCVGVGNDSWFLDVRYEGGKWIADGEVGCGEASAVWQPSQDCLFSGTSTCTLPINGEEYDYFSQGHNFNGVRTPSGAVSLAVRLRAYPIWCGTYPGPLKICNGSNP